MTPLRRAPPPSRASSAGMNRSMGSIPASGNWRASGSATTSRSEEHTSELQSLMRNSFPTRRSSVLSNRCQSAPATHLEGAMGGTIRPGAMRLADWRTIWRGAAVVLDRAADDAIAASAAAVARILGRHEPVYGINTGFGKLASVRIGDDELEMLQRNIVLSHAAGVGDPMPDRKSTRLNSSP